MVSVIVPVYNAEHCLGSCVEMILAQDIPDFELLLVDDGSSDKSGSLCDAYAQKDSRIRAFHKENGGASSARNLGLDQAKGEFLVFVDADDRIPVNHLSTLFQVQQETKADIVCGSVTYVPGPTMCHAACVCSAWELIQLVLYRDGVADYPVSKLYRRSLFDGLRFVEGITSEDFEIFYRLYRRANIVALTDKTTYYYIQNSTSVSNGGFSEKFFNRITICERLLRDVAEEKPELLPAAHSRAVDEAIWLYGILPSGRYPQQQEWIKQTIQKYGRSVLVDPKATGKVKKKIRIVLISPIAWKLRMRCKELLIMGATNLHGLKTFIKNRNGKE